METIPSEMLRGHVDTIILLSLLDCDKHTSQIKEEIESRVDGQFELKQGTYYSCLQRIVAQGYVMEYRSCSIDGKRRKFYQLTEKGKSYIENNKDKWLFSRSIIDTLISVPKDDTPIIIDYNKNQDKTEQISYNYTDNPQKTDVLPTSLYEKTPTNIDTITDKNVIIEKASEENTENGLGTVRYIGFSDDDSFKTVEKQQYIEKPVETVEETVEHIPDLFDYIEQNSSEQLDTEIHQESAKVENEINNIIDDKKRDFENNYVFEKREFEPHAENIEQNYETSEGVSEEVFDSTLESNVVEAVAADDTNESYKNEQMPVFTTDYIEQEFDSQANEFAEETVNNDNNNEFIQAATELEDDDFFSTKAKISRDYNAVLNKLFAASIPQPQVNYEQSLPNETTASNLYNIELDIDSLSVNTNDNNVEQEIKYEKPKKIRQKPLSRRAKQKAARFVTAKPAYDFSEIFKLADEEGFKVKASFGSNKGEIGKILINKLVASSSLMFFFLFLAEIAILAFTTSKIAEIDIKFYGYFAAACAIFPLFNLINYIIAPRRKIDNLISFKNVIELTLVVVLNLILIVFVYAIMVNINFANERDLMRYIFYPLIIVINLPIYFFIKYLNLEKQSYFS